MENDKVVTFAFKNETPGTVRYQEIDEAGNPQETAFAVIGALYIRKTALGKGNVPHKVTLTINYA